jgi:hypothetical protein
MATASKIRSCIKMKIKDLYKVDVTDSCSFPEAEKSWKSMKKNIVKEKRGEVDHHPEIDPDTLLKFYKLASNIKVAVEGRGTPEYWNLLKEVPVHLHVKMNYIIQYVAMMILESYEVRRGVENMENLLVSDFKVFDDPLYKFKYVRKVISEPEKQNQMGTNSQCAGVIPFIKLAGAINPGEFFQWYMGLLPTEAHKTKGQNYLFPKPYSPSKKFDIHNPKQCLFETNKKGGSHAVKIYSC